ncbi:KHG/KDPG aldolase [Euphorbia peplus]|nr:KHG/KDPG aldolase [Euphorbia peplus]
MDTRIASICCSSTPILAPKSLRNSIKFRVYSSSSSSSSSSPNRERTLSLIESCGVIACLRANSAELAFEAASAALRARILVLEIVMSTPGVLQVLQQLVHDYPAAALGVGTVLNADDAVKATRAGAKFLMSPVTVKGVMDVVQDGEVLYIPGAMTPTEILSAYEAGAKIVKVYPVSALGGKQYISALKRPFPHIPLVASQGITIDSIGAYITSGASSVVLSDAIFNKETMSQKNFDAIYKVASFAALQGQEAVTRKRLYDPN